MLDWQIPPTWGLRKLGFLAPEESLQVVPKTQPERTFNYWGLDAISQGQFDEPLPNLVSGSSIASTCISFSNQHVLYAKLRPYLNKVIIPTVEGIGTTEWIVLKPKPEFVDRYYLAYALRTQHFVDHITTSSAGARMPRARKEILFDSEIPIPYPDDPTRSLETQQRIVARLEALLSEVASARGLQEKIIDDTSNLLSAIIMSVFDESNHAWKTDTLSNVAFIQTGIAKGKRYGNRPTVELPYLRVANVQSGYLNLDEIKTIEIAESEIERYKLQKGDLLLTEGGDYDKLGRGAVWTGEIEMCIHQNHVFAVRFDQSQILPEFAEYQMQSNDAKNYFIRMAKKTTNLASINKTQLSNFPIRFPPSLNHQKQIIEQLKAVKSEVAEMQKGNQENSEMLTQLEQSFLAQVFRGEL